MRNQLQTITMKDFLTEIKYAGLTSRLKRLSDEILYNTRDFYKSVGLDIEPNWHLIFLLLEKHGSLTVTEISEELRMSHPACIKIINKMKKKDYITTKTDSEDSRKRLLELSPKAKDQLPSLHKHWDIGMKTVEELVQNNPHIFEAITELEEQIAKKSYKERVLENLEKKEDFKNRNS